MEEIHDLEIVAREALVETEADTVAATEEDFTVEVMEATEEEVLTEDLEKCTKQLALSAKKSAKYLSNLLKAGLSIVKTALSNQIDINRRLIIFSL